MAGSHPAPDAKRHLANWQDEIDSAALYRALAELEGIVAAYIEHSTQAAMPGLLASRRLLDELADQLEPDAA